MLKTIRTMIVRARGIVPLRHIRWRPIRRTALFASAGIFFAVAVALLWPLPQSFVHPPVQEPARIVDRHGTLLYEIRDADSGDLDPVPFARIPSGILSAVIATEDRRYWNHPGVDALGLARAMWQNISSGRIVSGASTITQQLVRIRSHRTNRSVLTKLLEMKDALRLEMVLSKEEILEAYLNSAYFGHQAYGIASAAHTYFGKNVSELSLPEEAMLAGLLQSPSAFDPFRSLTSAKKRQEAVLRSMTDAGVLTPEEAADAASEPIVLGEDQVSIEAPHFVFWMRQKHPELFTPGATVRTTLDLPLQQEVQRSARFELAKLKEKNVNSAAVVVLDAKTGDLLAMLGSPDYFDAEHDGNVNVAVAPRQPGSALKPFTYALALAGGDTLATTVADIEQRFFTGEGNPYTPRNYDYLEHGLVRYRESLANSYNIAAVKIMQRVGVERLLRFLQAGGITSLTAPPDHYGLALTLGDAEVPLLELAQTYGIFARDGMTLPLRTLMDEDVKTGNSAIDPRIAWLINSVLSDDDSRIPEFGRGGPLSFPFPVGVKTGTSRNGRDNWTMGFTRDRIVGVWVGNPDNTPMRDISGVTGAAPILHDVMLAAMQNLPKDGFPKPPDVISREICRLSGKLATAACREKMNEWFIEGTEPKTDDDIWRVVMIDSRNGLIAKPSCPKDVIVQKTFAYFPSELRSWAHDHGWPDPPFGTSPLCGTSAESGETVAGDFGIDWPHNGDAFEMDPLVPDSSETLTLRAHAPADVTAIEWRVNGTVIGTGKSPDYTVRWPLKEGSWTIEAKAGQKTDLTRTTVLKRRI